MSLTKFNQNKNMTIEYDIRSIDANGEAIDVQSYSTLAEAKKFVPPLLGEVVAWVIEKRKTNLARERTYTTIFFGGDNNALKMGNWNQ
jgi:hypothetical protein